MKEAYKLLSTIREVTENRSRSPTTSDENIGVMPRPRSSGDVYDLLNADRPRATFHGSSSHSMVLTQSHASFPTLYLIKVIYSLGTASPIYQTDIH